VEGTTVKRSKKLATRYYADSLLSPVRRRKEKGGHGEGMIWSSLHTKAHGENSVVGERSCKGGGYESLPKLLFHLQGEGKIK